MNLIIAILSAVLASLASASPTNSSIERRDNRCLDKVSAWELAEDYCDMIGFFQPAKADELLTDDFIEWSDSLNVLTGRVSGAPTYRTKADFIADQTRFVPTPLDIDGVEYFGCEFAVLRWSRVFDVMYDQVEGASVPKMVRGIAILDVIKNPIDREFWWKRAFVIRRVYTEFNSLSYFENMNGKCTVPTLPP